MKQRFILHPVLFAAAPILTLFNHNFLQMPSEQLLAPLAVTVAAALALWGALRLLLRDAHKAALLCSLWFLLFFSYGYARVLIARLPWPRLAEFMGQHALLLAIWGVVLLAGVAVTLRTRQNLVNMTGALNVLAGLLVLAPLGGLTHHWVMETAYARPESALRTRRQPVVSRHTDAAAMPNIYFLVLDGYARADVLQRVFGYDNRPFLDHLTRAGFAVADHSHANYSQTLLSVPSMLNMSYLQKPTHFDTQSQNRTPLVKLIEDSDVASFLRRQGYRIVAFPSEYSGVDAFDADVSLSPGDQSEWLTEFAYAVLSVTPLTAIKRAEGVATDQYESHRRRVLFTLDRLPQTTEMDGPVFVFAHILCPHPPFVFDAQGKRTEPDRAYALHDGSDFLLSGGTREEYRRGYAQQLAFLNTQLAQCVDRVLATSRRPTVIILLSDHGSGANLQWDEPVKTDMPERLSNLCAVYLSDGTAGTLIYDDITPVNLFTRIFNRYFGTQYAPQADRSYFSSITSPYHFIDVTRHLDDRLPPQQQADRPRPPATPR